MQIGEVASFQNGYAFKSKDFVQDGKYKIIKIKELKDGKVRFFNDSASVNVDDERIIEKYIAEKGDVLFALTGDPVNKNNPLSWVGRVSVYEDDQLALLNQRVCKLIPKEGLNAKYIYYYFRAFDNFYALASIAKGSASQANISTKDIEAMEIALPSLNIQNKIVSVLDSIEEKINQNNKINKNLLEQALAIYKDWFCDYALSDGILPEKWKITTIDAISSLVTRGIAPKYDDSSDQIVLNQKCIRDHTIDISLSRRHLPKKINEKWISKGDLLINSTGTGTLGRVAQVWFEANNMTVDSHVTIVRPKDPILQSYIGFWGLSHESEIEAQHTGSTGQTELPRDRVKAMELPLPDEDTLSKFNELVIPMASTVISNQEENARLSQLRDALLPKLMSGELDVSDIDL